MARAMSEHARIVAGGAQMRPMAIAFGALLAILAFGGDAEAGSRKGGRRVGSCGGFDAPDDAAWKEWSAATEAAVKAAWEPPVTARAGHPGLVLVRAHVRPDGVLEDATVVKSKGHESLTTAAVDALVGASPFAPLPASAQPGADEGLWLNYLFSYNVSPEAACKFRDKFQR